MTQYCEVLILSGNLALFEYFLSFLLGNTMLTQPGHFITQERGIPPCSKHLRTAKENVKYSRGETKC